MTTDLRTDSEIESLRRQLRGLARLVATVVLMAASLFAAAGIWHSDPAGADPLSGCSTTTGEIVVVDFAPWGGNIDRGCAAKLSTGYNAMISAGFTPAGDESDGPAFVCRIDDEPPPSEEACVDTPPASASWSYWHADAGQNVWTYSSQGAMSYEPPPGSVDAWTFGASNPNVKPPFPPSSVRANNPGPPVTTTTSSSPTTTDGTTTSTSTRTTSPPPSSQTRTPTTASSETPPTAATTSTSEPRGAGGTKPPHEHPAVFELDEIGNCRFRQSPRSQNCQCLSVTDSLGHISRVVCTVPRRQLSPSSVWREPGVSLPGGEDALRQDE